MTPFAFSDVSGGLLEVRVEERQLMLKHVSPRLHLKMRSEDINRHSAKDGCRKRPCQISELLWLQVVHAPLCDPHQRREQWRICEAGGALVASHHPRAALRANAVNSCTSVRLAVAWRPRPQYYSYPSYYSYSLNYSYYCDVPSAQMATNSDLALK